MARGDAKRAGGVVSGRYDRQVALGEIGAAGQARLRAASALVVGAGGLGAPVLQYLVGAGVGRIQLVDPDRVELGNLHRQPLFGVSDVGELKVASASRRLADLNPDVEVQPVPAPLTPANARDLISGADVVLDCADSYAVSYTLSDVCLVAGKPLFSASALGLRGYAGGFCGGAPSLRAVFPDPPQNAASCATAGVLGSLVGMIGALQAQVTLAHLIGLGPSPLGWVGTFAGDTLRFGGFRFDGAEEPRTGAYAFIAAEQVTPRDLAFELRGEEEAPRPALAGAARGAPTREAILDAAPDRVVLCCRSGLRSWRAAQNLGDLGDIDIVLLAAAQQEGDAS